LCVGCKLLGLFDLGSSLMGSKIVIEEDDFVTVYQKGQGKMTTPPPSFCMKVFETLRNTNSRSLILGIAIM